MPNVYYRIVRPLTLLVAVGTSASNTYLGTSREITRCHRATTFEPGAQLHHLIGGLLAVDQDGTYSVGISEPHHLFETRYHKDHHLDDCMMSGLVKHGYIQVIPESEALPRPASEPLPALEEGLPYRIYGNGDQPTTAEEILKTTINALGLGTYVRNRDNAGSIALCSLKMAKTKFGFTLLPNMEKIGFLNVTMLDSNHPAESKQGYNLMPFPAMAPGDPVPEGLNKTRSMIAQIDLNAR